MFKSPLEQSGITPGESASGPVLPGKSSLGMPARNELRDARAGGLSEMMVTERALLNPLDQTSEIEIQLTRGAVTSCLRLHAQESSYIRREDSPIVLYFSGLGEEASGVQNPFVSNFEAHGIVHISLCQHFQSLRARIDIPESETLLNAGRLAIDWLLAERKGPIVLSGFSLGGYIAARLAGEYGAGIEAITLLSPTFLPPWRGWAVNHLMLPLVNVASGLHNLFNPQRLSLFSDSTLKALAAVLDSRDHLNLFTQLRMPVQISVGSRELFSQAYMEELLRTAHHQDNELRVIARAGHSPDSVERLLTALSFIEDHSAAFRGKAPN